MPRKKKEPAGEVVEEKQDLAAELQSGTPVEVFVEKVVEKIARLTSCGHINKQYTNTKGKMEDLACTLPSGHTGNHEAGCESLRGFSGEKDPDSTYLFRDGKYYLVVQDVTEWSDAAGVPADKIRPDYEGFSNRHDWEQERKRKRGENRILTQ